MMFNDLDLIQLKINSWTADPKNNIYYIVGKLNLDEIAQFRKAKLLYMKINFKIRRDRCS